MPWLYQIDKDFTYRHPALEGIEYRNEWCCIEGGALTIKRGYAHDGCSPKFDILGLVVLGVPDGRSHLGKPITHDASLVHDVFCQFRDEIPISKANTVQIFRDMLDEPGFKLAWVYSAFVDSFGPQDFQIK
ncbi:hypothetical protein [Neptuniibacter sp.]|uniref:hypothetical protein n=1 Tax=Neptuniibacter sp. TaxID=1962643 RepID=UPI00260B38ED|nr:hypothetical protein [Neptuniibacter sp.]MCP4595774.1 hypothetical protein [Neptuniibacter sp.]